MSLTAAAAATGVVALVASIAVLRTRDEIRRLCADANVLGMSASSLYVRARHLPSQIASSCFDLSATITTALHANLPPSEANAIGVSAVNLPGGLRFGFWLSCQPRIDETIISWDIAATSS